MKSALFDVSLDGWLFDNDSESRSSLRIAFFLLDPPLLGVFAGVFLPGVFRIGIFFPGVRRVRGLFLSDVLISFLCGKKL